MRKHKLRTVAATAALLPFAACTPLEVRAVADHFGVVLDDGQTAAVAVHFTAHPDQVDRAIADLQPGPCDVQCIIRSIWPDATEGWALAVARCESSLNPRAKNGSHAGLFQLARRYHEPKAEALGLTWDEVATEARPNTEVALHLYREQGAAPWAASKRCWS